MRPLAGCLRFGWLCLGTQSPGLKVVASTARSAGKARIVCERLWFVAWACVAWCGLCGLRGAQVLRLAGFCFSELLVVVARSRCVVQWELRGLCD